MASMAILGLIMVVLFSVFDQVNKAWLGGENRVETFTQARAILDLMSRELSQAVATTKVPFYLQDPQHIYFVAPVNTDTGSSAADLDGSSAADLCEVGYEFVNIPATQPATLKRRLTKSTSPLWDFYTSGTWFNTFDAANDTFLSDGTVLNVTFTCNGLNGGSLGPSYSSAGNGGRLPYSVQITMDVIDSRTLARLKVVNDPTNVSHQQITQSALRSFTTTVYLSNTSP
jgi:hypothetical protein